MELKAFSAIKEARTFDHGTKASSLTALRLLVDARIARSYAAKHGSLEIVASKEAENAQEASEKARLEAWNALVDLNKALSSSK
jgi:hypothetical protein